ncbi:U3 small nucleolar RNA-interacting protein 2 [Tritrichomonas foetus]|uniref:U3 small nucleolar RNA-interacting protein 2 n=1 Tax=Tritrichomonas foetus TaxID=1144522 RepID=A0A1J4JCB2_9EUKA|nr:U3 small nucleolar RNA-interacting protein 2 [Tritrichomonas foetus]|eukprot:OHS96776.1 U3 small nucleolar RNA-interacting protein 2 [Tritrichomonas foetus]
MKRKPIQEDDSIDSDDIPDQSTDDESESDSANLDNLFTETAEEKKLRLTKEYIAGLKEDLSDDEAVAERLSNDYEQESGKRFAPKILQPISSERYRAHERGWPTAFAMGNNCFYSAAKDGSIVRVTLNPRHKFDISLPSNVAVFCLAYDDLHGQLASGDEKGHITVWDAENGIVLLELNKHSGAISGLAYQPRTYTLFSCSYDNTIRVWDCEAGNCLATLFGHTLEANAIDYLGNAVTVGSDHTLRLWKYEQEKQLVFHGGGIKGSIDCVSLFNFTYCVTGSQDGRICFWDLSKKKPVAMLKDAHGEGRWITAISTLRFHKFFASGSYDGKIRFWRITDENRIEQVFEYDLVGYVNDMHFSDDGEYLAVQISQELRFGRWLPKIQEARQGVHYIKLDKVSD